MDFILFLLYFAFLLFALTGFVLFLIVFHTRDIFIYFIESIAWHSNYGAHSTLLLIRLKPILRLTLFLLILLLIFALLLRPRLLGRRTRTFFVGLPSAHETVFSACEDGLGLVVVLASCHFVCIGLGLGK